MIRLVTGIATKPSLSGNMFPNIKTFENRRSNFSGNLRTVALKLLELTRILSPNLSNYSYLLKFCTVWGSFVIIGDPRSTAGLLFPSRCLHGTILPTLYSMVLDWRVSRAEPNVFICLSCSLSFCLLLFSLSLLTFCR